MDYVDAAMTYILSPDVLPIEKLRSMLRHIKLQLPSIMHLPISLNDTLHFYWYLKKHVLVADGQFLLLIDVPIKDRAQLQIYEMFQPTSSTWCYISSIKISYKYTAITCIQNTSGHDYRTAVLNMPPHKWPILQNRCTISSPHESTIMQNDPICKD